jgi:hypothetical protein
MSSAAFVLILGDGPSPGEERALPFDAATEQIGAVGENRRRRIPQDEIVHAAEVVIGSPVADTEIAAASDPALPVVSASATGAWVVPRR